jgi:hypothetical protein
MAVNTGFDAGIDRPMLTAVNILAKARKINTLANMMPRGDLAGTCHIPAIPAGSRAV